MSDESQEIQSFVKLVEATPSPAGATSAPAPATGGKGKPRMTKAQRAECTIAWRLGTMSPTELAKKYGVTVRALYLYFSGRGIKHGELADRQVKAVESASKVDAEAQAQKVRETKDETYKLLTWIRKMVQNELLVATKNNVKLGTIMAEIRTLKEAAAAVKTTREEIYVLLGIKEGDLETDDLPELRIRGLNEEEIAQLQQQDNDDLEGALAAQIEEIPGDDDDLLGDDTDDEEGGAGGP